jgi:hypothetical protein
MLIAFAIIVGFLLAWLRGARLSVLADLRVRAVWLVFVALAIQLSIFTPISPAVPAALEVSLHLASYALLLLFVLANIRLPGLVVAAVGFACNLVAISSNGGRMPVSESSWKASGAAVPAAGTDGNVVLSDSDTRLWWLGDIVPLPLGPLANTVSVGDLLLLIGVTTLVYRACRGIDVGKTPPVVSGSPGEPANLPAVSGRGSLDPRAIAGDFLARVRSLSVLGGEGFDPK